MKKQARKINRVCDLPEWFDLNKYKTAEYLDSAGWFEQLFLRYNLWKHIRNFHDERKKTSKNVTLDDVLQELLDDMRENPIVDYLNNELHPLMLGYGMIPENNDELERFQYGVRPLTVVDVYTLESDIDLEKRDFLRKYYFRDASEIHEISRPSSLERPDWFNAEIDFIRYKWLSEFNLRLSEVHAKINLELPDNILMDEFKSFLRNTRERLGGKVLENKKRRQPDFSKWIRYGVLPYIDLRMWEMEADSKITWRVYADAIFSEEAMENGKMMDGETVRETTASLADKVLEFQNLEILTACAIQEKSGKKSV